MRRRIVIVGMLAALAGLTSLPAPSPAPAADGALVRRVAQQAVAVDGFVEEVGDGFLVVNGLRFETRPATRVLGGSGMPLPGGLAALPRRAEVRLLVDEWTVLQVQLVELMK